MLLENHPEVNGTIMEGARVVKQWSHVVVILGLPHITIAARPADSPCVNWVRDDKCGAARDFEPITDWLPSPPQIFAWQWEMNKAGNGGTCSFCNVTKGPCHGGVIDGHCDFDCGYVLPCFADGPDMFGHRDISLSSVGCKFQYPNGSAGHQCAEWTPKKGPQASHFGWQVSQKDSAPDKGIGQLITDPTGEFVLARSPAAEPFVNCLPGVLGWVKLQEDGTLGSMQYAANIVPVTMSNGFEVACKPNDLLSFLMSVAPLPVDLTFVCK